MATGSHNQLEDNEQGPDSLYYQDIQNSLNSDTTHTYPNTRWALQYLISSHLPSLTPNAGYEHAKTLALADAAYNNEDYGTALSLTNSFNAGNIIESNWQSVNTILIKLQNDTLNSSDISTLQSVASQCPLAGGNIVWTARTLLSAHYRYPMEYPNDCPVNNGGGERLQNAASINNTVSKQQSVNLYPNPNNGSFTISYTGAGKQLTVEAYNVMGQQILNQQYPIANTNNIPVNGLIEGVYFIKINVDNAVVKTEKIIVTK